MRGAPIAYLNPRGGLAGLGQGQGQFTEEALFALQAQIAQVSAEADAVEAEIDALQSGRPIPARPVADAGRIQVTPARGPALPGGSVNLPIVGRVPVLALGAVAAALLFSRRK